MLRVRTSILPDTSQYVYTDKTVPQRLSVIEQETEQHVS